MLPTMSSLSDIHDREKDGRRFCKWGGCRAVGGDAGGVTENTWHQTLHIVGVPSSQVKPPRSPVSSVVDFL